jgi:2-oxoglutarate ferredoxin oxidoreductase subunit alpha
MVVMGESRAMQSLKSASYACSEGAIAAGCTFYSDYPAEQFAELGERMSHRLPQVGGHYLQMGDQTGCIAAALGASSGGLKSMAAASGPELSAAILGSAAMDAETPCVLLNIQSMESDGDLLGLASQRETTHARSDFCLDGQTIAYAPNSVQEMFYLTVKAFNIAERYCRPTVIMADRGVINMTDRLTIPEPGELKIVGRRKIRRGSNLPVAQIIQDLPPIALIHRDIDLKIGNPATGRNNDMLTNRGHIRNGTDRIAEVEHYLTADAEAVIVAYGSTSRSAMLAVDEARRANARVGLLRLITPSPFPGKEIEGLGADKIIVPDIDHGQLERLIRGCTSSPVISIHHEIGTNLRLDEVYETYSKE